MPLANPLKVSETCDTNRNWPLYRFQEGCYEAVLPSERGDHIRSHDAPYGQYNSLDALFRRKRGRPPKNRVIEVWNDYAGVSTGDSPQAIFTSFKLPKPSQPSEETEVPTQTTLVKPYAARRDIASFAFLTLPTVFRELPVRTRAVFDRKS